MELLLKSKKDLLNMYGAGITPHQSAHVQWAHSKMPNENWSLWAVRAHRQDPSQFTPEVKEKVEHFAGSQHIPEVAKVRFEKGHDLNTGLKMLEDAEAEYNKKIAGNANVVKPDASTKKVLDVGDGMAWYSLGRGSCSAEGKAMGHCGNVPSEKPGDRVLSLRTEHKDSQGNVYHEPHATFIVNGGYLGEMKGRGNTKPTKKYHKAIADLLLHPKIKGTVGGGYLHHQNFNVEDLEPKQKERVLKEKPNINVYEGLNAPADLPEKFKDEVEPIINWKKGLQEKTQEPQSSLFEKPKNWREAAIQEIAEGKAPRMALNAIPNPTDDELHSIVSGEKTNDDSRVQAAMIGKDSARLHAALANTSPDSISYLNNPNIDAIIGTKNEDAIKMLASNQSLTAKDLDKIVEHPEFNNFSPEAQQRLLNQEELNPKHHEKFINSPHKDVRSSLAVAKNLDPRFHEKLANDPDAEVRGYLARSAKLSPELQNKLAEDSPNELAQNKNLSPEAGEKLAQMAVNTKGIRTSGDSELAENLLQNESLSPKAIEILSTKKDEDNFGSIYTHPNLSKELFDKLVDKHSKDPENFKSYRNSILRNPHLSPEQFKKLKTKFGRSKESSRAFKEHPFYEAKESEIEPMANQDMLLNHLNKLKESNPEKHKATQEKLIGQAIEEGNLEPVNNLIQSGALDDEHLKRLHDELSDVDTGDHKHSDKQQWTSNDYKKMLYNHLNSKGLPKSHYEETLNRLGREGEEPSEIAEKVFDENRDDYNDEIHENADEIARENYPYEDFLSDFERGHDHPLDAHVKEARDRRRSYNKADLSGLHAIAEERAMKELKDKGKIDEEGNYKDSDYEDAIQNAKDSVHEDFKTSLNDWGHNPFPKYIQDEIEKHRENLYEDYDEAVREGSSYDNAYGESEDQIKEKLNSDPSYWPKHLQETNWVKEHVKPESKEEDIDAVEPADQPVDEFGVKKSDLDFEKLSVSVVRAREIIRKFGSGR